MNKIIFTEGYESRARGFFREHPELAGDYRRTLSLLTESLQNPSLKLKKTRVQAASCYTAALDKRGLYGLHFLASKNTLFPVSLEILMESPIEP